MKRKDPKEKPFMALGLLTLFILALAIGNGVKAQEPITDLVGPLLEAFPVLNLIFAGGAVLVAAPLVRTAVEWFRTRYYNWKKKEEKMPNWLTHLVSLVISIGVSYMFFQNGSIGDEFLAFGYPWSIFLFAAAVFLRAGGLVDVERGKNG